MKLYVWRGQDVLTNYSSGIAFAMAESLQDAILHIRTAYITSYQQFYFFPTVGMEDEDFRNEVEEKLNFLNDEPEIFDSPIGMFQQGGE